MATPDDSFPWVKVLLFFNVALLAWLFNPWTDDPGALAWAILAIELAFATFWLFPVFLYQTLVKGRPMRESFERAAKSLTEMLTYF